MSSINFSSLSASSVVDSSAVYSTYVYTMADVKEKILRVRQELKEDPSFSTKDRMLDDWCDWLQAQKIYTTWETDEVSKEEFSYCEVLTFEWEEGVEQAIHRQIASLAEAIVSKAKALVQDQRPMPRVQDWTDYTYNLGRLASGIDEVLRHEQSRHEYASDQAWWRTNLEVIRSSLNYIHSHSQK